MPSCTIDRMSVPDRVEAAHLLLSLDPPPWHLRHSRAVAETAAWLAGRIAGRGIPIDRRLVEAAALLHDVDKLLPAGDPAARLPHGGGSAAWLARHGAAELARATANHPVTRLAEEERYRRWSAFSTREERVVAYADKRCGQRLEPMANRFAAWGRRFPAAEEVESRAGTRAGDGDRGPAAAAGVGASRDRAAAAGVGASRDRAATAGVGPSWDRATLLRVRRRAERLEADVCQAAGILPAEVRRLRWTAAALARART